MKFWDFLWLLFIRYILIVYLMILFSIFADLFKDHELGGFAESLWVIFLIMDSGAITQAEYEALEVTALVQRKDATIVAVRWC